MVKKIGSFWIIIFGLIIFGYFCSANRDWITVTVPYVSEVRVRAAEVYLWSFFLGTAVTFSFFSIELTRKSITIRKLNKKLREMESQTPPVSISTAESNEDQTTDKTDFPSPQLEAAASHDTTMK